MDWKNILALAALAIPLAYCSVEDARITNDQKIVCIEKRGNWSGKTCIFE